MIKFLIVSAIALFCFVKPCFANENRIKFMSDYIVEYWQESGWDQKIEMVDDYPVLFEQKGNKTVINSDYPTIVATWFEEAAYEFDVDPFYLLAIAKWESGYRIWALGDGGKSYGLMQIRKPSHISQFNNEKFGSFDDPYELVRYSAYKLSQNAHNIWTVWKKGTAKKTYKQVVARYNKTE